MSPLTYRQALDYILGLSGDLERSASIPYSARLFKLERPRRLIELLGVDPQAVPAVHIAGTKGKGSTAAMVTSVLRAAGYRVGLFTSPHLRTYRERLSIDDTPISEAALAALVAAARPAVDRLHAEQEWGLVTPFELTTALALQWFVQQRVDVQVLETGLGGRLDATNIVTPLAAAITSISLDHTHVLGDTIEQIAAEKAGILKPGVPVAIGRQQPAAERVLLERAWDVGAAPVVRVGDDVRIESAGAVEPIVAGSEVPPDRLAQPIVIQGRLDRYHLRLPLLGLHQVENAATAIATIECLPARGLAVPAKAIDSGLRQVRWPGRLQVLRAQPLVVADAAHNVDSARRLAESLDQYFLYDRLILVFAASADKDLAGMAALLGPRADRVVVSRTRHSRAASLPALRAAFEPRTKRVVEVADVAAAIDRAVADASSRDLICVAGSVFTAAEAISWAEHEPVPVAVV